MRHPRFQLHLLFTIVYATFPPPFRRLGGGESPRVAAAQRGSATSTETVPAGPRDGAGESHRFSQSSTRHKLILMASSTRSMVCLESRPTFFWSRDRSTDRIWLTVTAERFGKPLSAGAITTSLGNGGSENWELMAATMVTGLYWLERVLLALPMPWLVLGAKERFQQRQVNVNHTIELPGADRWNAETRLHVGTWWRVYRGGLIGYEARKRTSAESIRGGPGELRGRDR